jgi:hypothetical protein
MEWLLLLLLGRVGVDGERLALLSVLSDRSRRRCETSDGPVNPALGLVHT